MFYHSKIKLHSAIWRGFVMTIASGMMFFLVWQVISLAAESKEATPGAGVEQGESGYPSPSSFDPAAQAGFGQPAQTVTHHAFLENRTGSDNSFDLSLGTGYNWSATVSPTQTAVLTAGASVPITVTVVIPPDATEGDMDSLTLQAQAVEMPWHTDSALMDTAVICDPHLSFSGYSLEQVPLDRTFEFGDQKFAYLLLNIAHFPHYLSTNVVVTGYNQVSDEWELITEWATGQSAVHETLFPPSFSKIRIQASSSSPNVMLRYEYQFAVCREPSVGFQPASEIGYASAGETAVYQQTLFNWAMGDAAYDLSVAGNSWPVSFWRNGSEITRTTLLADQETFAFEVRVETPPGVSPGAGDEAVIQATAVTTPTITNSANIATYITGDFAYVTLSGNKVAVVDTANNALMDVIDVAASGCSSPQRAAITPDGGQVYVSCWYSNNVMVIDTATLTVVHTIGTPSYPYDMVFSRDGAYAFIGSSMSSGVRVVNTSNYFQLPLSTNGISRSLAAHPFLDLIYVISDWGQISVLDATTFNWVGSIDMDNELEDLVISPDGQWLYVSEPWGGGLSIIDLNANNVVARVTVPRLAGLDITPDGTKLYGGRAYNSGLYVIDTATLAVTPLPTNGNTWQTAVTCDGSQIYAGSNDNYVSIIEAATNNISVLPMPGSGTHGIAICPQFVSEGIIVFPKTQQKQVALGATAVYTTSLRNETGQTDSFDLSLTGNSWPTELSASSVGPLDQGNTTTVVVTVTIPAEANWYDTDVVTLTAASAISPTAYSETVVLTTEAYAPPQISVSPDALSNTQLVNSQITQTVSIHNGHGVTLTYDLAILYSAATPAQLPTRPIEPPAAWLPENWLPAETLEVVETTASAPSLYPILIDPLGDGGPADVIEVLAGVNATHVSMKLVFAPGVIPQNVYGHIFLDTDQNSATGGNPVHWFGLPTQDVGFEYRLFISPPAGYLYRSDGYYMGGVAPVYDANSVLFTIPLAMLGDDDGYINVAMVLGDYWSPTEWAPDNGHGVIGGSGQYDWLTVSPENGTVFSNDSETITVAYNSHNLQPGVYPAFIRARHNDPANTTLNIPVEMIVEPTAVMGWVEGYVTDGRFGTPLQATITAQGQPYTITAGLDGYYKLWLEAGSYDLRVSAPGYVADQLPIAIVAQQALNQDISLVENVPVFTLAPDEIAITQYVGEIADETTILFNAGPAEMSFVISQRETTSGLALLAHFARSEAEISARLAEKAEGDNHNAGAPTVAAIPAEAFVNLTGSVNLLAWTGYVDYDEEYANSLNAIAQYAVFNLTETTTEDPIALAALLATADVFFIPEQELSHANYLFNLGQSWADVLQLFVNNGGAIVLLDHCVETFQILQGAGLVNMQRNFCSSSATMEVVNSEHPLVAGVPPTFLALSGTAFYTIYDNGETVVKRASGAETVVMAKDVGEGRVTVIGFDFFTYNDDMARILANATQWVNATSAPWLNATPATGSVTGYDEASVQITLDATGLQPGLYTADLIVTTNDPYTPTLILPISMETLPTTSMGQVAGTITDAWTENPLAATVQLEGVYAMTAEPTYNIWAEAGSYTLTVTADGYMSATIPVLIAPGGLTTQNVALVPAQPRLQGLPETIAMTAVAGHTASYAFTLTNAGPLPLIYAWHEISQTVGIRGVASDLTGKSILYDASHGGAWYGNFSILLQDITDAGGVVVVNQNDPVTAALLAPHDILWVNCCGYTSWTADELAAVSAWLGQGRAIFIHGPDMANTQPLANLFDIQYTGGSAGWGNTTNILPHPTTEGIHTIYIDYAPSSLTYTSASDVLVYDSYNYPVVVAQERRNERIVVVAAFAFGDSYIQSEDNRAFALNIMNWLASPVYTDVPWVYTEPVTGSIPAYGEQLFAMTFDAAGLSPGIYEMTLVLEQNDPAHEPILFIPVTLEVTAQEAAVAIEADTLSQTAAPGETAVYEITIVNNGNAPDSFAISAAGEWPAHLSATNTGLLGIGESFTVMVTMLVPEGTAHGVSDITAVTITSDFDPSVNQTASLTTTAVIATRYLYLPVVIRP